ncbi:MAG: hypothetical protein WBQ55_28550 [Xanthobacteraceae bacterium]
MSVVPFDRYRNSYDDMTTHIMGEAYQAACEALHGNEPAVVHEVLAKRILHAARMGERNYECLRDIALAGIVYS